MQPRPSAPIDLNSLSRNARQAHHRGQQQSELDRYLSGTCSPHDDPLVAWKEEEVKYPALARMAKDVLAISIAGVGVERTFNMARDVCHYRRGQLNSESVKQAMIIKHHQRAHWSPLYDSVASTLDKQQSDDISGCEQVIEVEEEALDAVDESDEEASSSHQFDFLDDEDLQSLRSTLLRSQPLDNNANKDQQADSDYI